MKFYTPELKAWLGGYEPVIGERMVADKKARAGTNTSKRMAEQRMKPGRDPLKGWGLGTIPSLGKPSDPGKAGRIRKPSGM